MRPWYDRLSVFWRGLLLLALIVPFFPAGQTAEAAQVETVRKRSRLGISLPSFRESRWQFDIQALQGQAGAQGADILVRFAGNDQKQQNAQVKELVDLGIDALIMAPTDVFNALDGVVYAKEHGVPVVSYDRLAENCDVDAYVAFERSGVGELMGGYLAGHAPKGKYILLRGPKHDTNAQEFFDGAMSHILPLIQSGDVTVALEAEVAGWRADVAEKLVEAALGESPDIVAVLAPNDDTAGGAIEALSRFGLAGKVLVTGQDATLAGLERISKGLQGMTVLKDTNLLARQAVAAALSLANNGRIRDDFRTPNGWKLVPTIKQPVIFVDKNNLNWVLRLSEFH